LPSTRARTETDSSAKKARMITAIEDFGQDVHGDEGTGVEADDRNARYRNRELFEEIVNASDNEQQQRQQQEETILPRSDSPAIDISFANRNESHYMTSVQEVYTNAAILDAAHQTMHFLDSKDFVDTEIRTSASLTISDFLNVSTRYSRLNGQREQERGGESTTNKREVDGILKENESAPNMDVFQQFFEGHFYSGPSGLNDLKKNSTNDDGEEIIADELVNLLSDWTEAPAVVMNLFHRREVSTTATTNNNNNNNDNCTSSSSRMNELNTIKENEEGSVKKEEEEEEEEVYKHHARAIQLAQHCNDTWPLLARSVAPSTNLRQATPLEYATGSSTPNAYKSKSPLSTPKKTPFPSDRVSALTGSLKQQLQFGNNINPVQQQEEQFQQQQKSSLISLPNVAIVPGERFRETYYWDTFWVALGLLECDMFSTATGVIRNLLYMVERFGFVPNGSRVYYLNRSQPPVLATAVRAVYEKTRDIDLLKYAVPLLQREHVYMTKPEKCVNVVSQKTGNLHTLSRYWAYTEKPRPESYREDLHTAQEFCELFCNKIDSKESDQLRADLFRDIASAAESGHDFSSRWFEDRQSIRTIRTTKIVPADLNGFMFKMERDLAWLARQLEQNVESVEDVENAQEVAVKFEIMAETRRNAIFEVLWDDSEEKRWRDLVLRRSKFDSYTVAPEDMDSALHKNNRFDDPDAVYEYSFAPGPYASDWVPLWCGVFEKNSKEAMQACESLTKSPIVNVAGISCSTVKSGEQWDFPNVWAPLTHMLVEGLDEFGGDEYKSFAKENAHKYLKSVSKGLRLSGAMHEKYDARFFGAIGRGGEYAPQTGFGWSNAVALVFLSKYGGWDEEREDEQAENVASRMGLQETS
jgi:alpha,alpha-trehalase